MRSYRAANMAIFLAISGVFAAEPAFAQERACAQLSVDADAGVNERWPDLPERVRAALDTHEGIDACARVTLRSSADAIAVQVVLADGRSALRSAARQEDVVPTLEALLLVPRRAVDALEPAPPEAPAAADRAKPVATPSAPSFADRAPQAPSEAQPPRGVRIEFAITSSVRFGVDADDRNLGIGALSFIDIDRWLLGFAGRFDRYLPAAGNPAWTALEVAALGGRRIWLRSLALDLVAGPVLAFGAHTAEVVAVSSGTMTPQPRASIGSVPRALFGARLNFGARSLLRTFVGIDGELGAVPRASAQGPGNTARAPIFSVGLALGASVGTP